LGKQLLSRERLQASGSNERDQSHDDEENYRKNYLCEEDELRPCRKKSPCQGGGDQDLSRAVR